MFLDISFSKDQYQNISLQRHCQPRGLAFSMPVHSEQMTAPSETWSLKKQMNPTHPYEMVNNWCEAQCMIHWHPLAGVWHCCFFDQRTTMSTVCKMDQTIYSFCLMIYSLSSIFYCIPWIEFHQIMSFVRFWTAIFLMKQSK